MPTTVSEFVLLQAFQVTLLVGAIWLITRTVTRNHAHLSYVLWLVVLVKCVTPPLWASPAGVFSWIYAAQVPAPQYAEATLPTKASFHASEEAGQRTPAGGLQDADIAFAYPALDVPFARPIENHELEHHVGSVAVPGPSIVLCKTTWLLSGCLVVTGLLICSAFWRTFRCTRDLKRNEIASTDLTEQVEKLRVATGVRNEVRLVVTTSRVGPGVIGLVRPTIVLPQAVVEQRTAEEMTPILVHELIHIRRGDLWVGLLRHLTQALWWFHPLVWIAGRQVRHGAEKCCDEEVIASLGISPSAYAHSLLSVLETKQQLKALPLVPGVRPVEITSQRLEKIMKLEKHRSSTPHWCWVLAALVAIVSLPGAGSIVGQQPQNDSEPNSTYEKSVDDSPDFLIGQAVNSDAGLTGQIVTDESDPNTPSAVLTELGDKRNVPTLANAGQQATDIAIQKALNSPVKVEFYRAPLKIAIEELTSPFDINVFFGPNALPVATKPVTMELRKPVSLKSALNLILDPYGLTYETGNEALRITTVDPFKPRRQDAYSGANHTAKRAGPDVPMELVPLNVFRRSPSKEYKLNAGDIVGLFVDGILGESEQAPPVNFPDLEGGTPSVGFPIPVREDGTLPLPLIDPVDVQGLSLIEAKNAILRAYTVEKELLQREEARILISLVRPRRVKVLVFRQDVDQRLNPLLDSRGISSQASRVGFNIDLPATEADVLSILAQSGGLPTSSAGDEIFIYRAGERGTRLRIPIRMPVGGELPKLSENDVTLFDGDTVVVPRRDVKQTARPANRR